MFKTGQKVIITVLLKGGENLEGTVVRKLDEKYEPTCVGNDFAEYEVEFTHEVGPYKGKKDSVFLSTKMFKAIIILETHNYKVIKISHDLYDVYLMNEIRHENCTAEAAMRALGSYLYALEYKYEQKKD